MKSCSSTQQHTPGNGDLKRDEMSLRIRLLHSLVGDHTNAAAGAVGGVLAPAGASEEAILSANTKSYPAGVLAYLR